MDKAERSRIEIFYLNCKKNDNIYLEAFQKDKIRTVDSPNITCIFIIITFGTIMCFNVKDAFDKSI